MPTLPPGIVERSVGARKILIFFLLPSKFFYLDSQINRQINRRNPKFNTCAWGIHTGIKSPKSETTLGIKDILDKGEKEGMGC